jgi:hypothetical protein
MREYNESISIEIIKKLRETCQSFKNTNSPRVPHRQEVFSLVKFTQTAQQTH